jgi:transposase
VGYDAAKKIKGKKRYTAVDTLGLMLGGAVTPASVQDRDQIALLLKEVQRLFPFLERALSDSSYQGATTAAAVRKAARLPLEIVKRCDTKGFVVLPKRWIPAFARTSRTFGWLGRCRRLAKAFENLTRSHLAFVQLAMIRLMMRRIARLSLIK